MSSVANKYLEKVAELRDELKQKSKGLLHRKMGIDQDKHISTGALEAEKAKAKASGNTKLEREVVFAENARKWHHR